MNNNEIKVFTNNLFGSVRAINVEGKVWFVGRDAVKCLGYEVEGTTSYTYYTGKFVKEKYTLKMKNCDLQLFGMTDAGRKGEVLINQNGIIQLVMNSPMEEAERFQDWILEEVIPSVLKYGAYIGEDANQDYIKYNYESIKHQVATLPVEQLEEYVVGCLEFHKQEETRIVKAPQAKCRKGTKWSKSESKMKIMQRLHDSLIQRQNDYLAEGKLGFAHEITPIVYKLKDAIKVLCNNINGGQKASHTRATK